MNPPPPRFPALGCVTASAKAVATAASTAFPPRPSIDAPISDARPETETTTPRFDATVPVSRAAVWAAVDAVMANEAAIANVASLRMRTVIDGFGKGRCRRADSKGVMVSLRPGFRPQAGNFDLAD